LILINTGKHVTSGRTCQFTGQEFRYASHLPVTSALSGAQEGSALDMGHLVCFSIFITRVMTGPIMIKYEGVFYHITALFGSLSFTAVSKTNQRLIMRMKKDRKLRRRDDDILRNMSHVKG